MSALHWLLFGLGAAVYLTVAYLGSRVDDRSRWGR